ncbi:MAG: radical SAM protein [Deltaproteobacteria bacterium]|nr:radical SAM protein [Deltaproteobacteria bacterium]
MQKISLDAFKDDAALLEQLKRLPRYKNTKIRSAYRRLAFFLSLAYCRITGIMKPIFIVLVTNNSCNLKCVYCYGEYGARGHYKDYSTKELIKIIDELKSLGTRLLTIHGGESLLRKDIGEIINYAKHRGFYISFNTNGYLLPKRIQEIKCVDTICISLDGREENNDKNRGAGCHKKVMEAIDVVSHNNIPLAIHATLTKSNMNDMEYLAELATAKKIRVQYSILYNADEITDKNLVMSDEEIRAITKKILNLKKQGYPIYYSENVLTTAIEWPDNFYEKNLYRDKDMDAVNKKNLIPCYHGSLKYQIDADGRVVTCWANNYDDAPNIKELGVSGAIRSCHDKNDCRHCSFLANNEHNALMNLSPRNILNILLIQLADALKIKG